MRRPRGGVWRVRCPTRTHTAHNMSQSRLPRVQLTAEAAASTHGDWSLVMCQRSPVPVVVGARRAHTRGRAHARARTGETSNPFCGVAIKDTAENGHTSVKVCRWQKPVQKRKSFELSRNPASTLDARSRAAPVPGDSPPRPAARAQRVLSSCAEARDFPHLLLMSFRRFVGGGRSTRGVLAQPTFKH